MTLIRFGKCSSNLYGYLVKFYEYLRILLNRFYLETVKQQIRRSVDDIQNQIAFSNKLSYLGQLASAAGSMAGKISVTG